MKRGRETRLHEEGAERCGIAGVKMEEGADLLSWEGPGNTFPLQPLGGEVPGHFSPGRTLLDF